MLIDDKHIVLLDEVKIAIKDYESEFIYINFKCHTTVSFESLSDFEAFAKKLYTAYRKYKYVFGKEKK